MESMQRRVTLEEHHGHANLPPPVHENTLARADAGRRDEADTVQHFLEGFLTTGGEKFFLLAFLLS